MLTLKTSRYIPHMFTDEQFTIENEEDKVQLTLYKLHMLYAECNTTTWTSKGKVMAFQSPFDVK